MKGFKRIVPVPWYTEEKGVSLFLCSYPQGLFTPLGRKSAQGTKLKQILENESRVNRAENQKESSLFCSPAFREKGSTADRSHASRATCV